MLRHIGRPTCAGATGLLIYLILFPLFSRLYFAVCLAVRASQDQANHCFTTSKEHLCRNKMFNWSIFLVVVRTVPLHSWESINLMTKAVQIACGLGCGWLQEYTQISCKAFGCRIYFFAPRTPRSNYHCVLLTIISLQTLKMCFTWARLPASLFHSSKKM